MDILLWILAGFGVIFLVFFFIVIVFIIKTNIAEGKYKRKFGISIADKTILEIFGR